LFCKKAAAAITTYSLAGSFRTGASSVFAFDMYIINLSRPSTSFITNLSFSRPFSKDESKSATTRPSSTLTATRECAQGATASSQLDSNNLHKKRRGDKLHRSLRRSVADEIARLFPVHHAEAVSRTDRSPLASREQQTAELRESAPKAIRSSIWERVSCASTLSPKALGESGAAAPRCAVGLGRRCGCRSLRGLLPFWGDW